MKITTSVSFENTAAGFLSRFSIPRTLRMDSEFQSHQAEAAGERPFIVISHV